MTTLTGLEMEFRRRVIEHYLAASGGVVSETARRLGMQRSYLWVLVRVLGIDLAGLRAARKRVA